MNPKPTILDEILAEVRKEIATAKQARPLSELQRMLADAPPVRPFKAPLSARFGLIAEIKERSPSQGEMRRENVQRAAAAYEQSGLVRGISVLTNQSHFGMNIERLRQVKLNGSKPVLRKDFLFDEYQVYEARAFGADAVLLMANVLNAEEMERLFALCRTLGMAALFECHDREQIARVPAEAEIYGINSRTFATDSGTYRAARADRAAGAQRDFTTDLSRFELGLELPDRAVKVAESGVHPDNVAAIRQQGIFHAVLVGTSLLTAKEGIEIALSNFEGALAASRTN